MFSLADSVRSALHKARNEGELKPFDLRRVERPRFFKYFVYADAPSCPSARCTAERQVSRQYSDVRTVIRDHRRFSTVRRLGVSASNGGSGREQALHRKMQHEVAILRRPQVQEPGLRGPLRRSVGISSRSAACGARACSHGGRTKRRWSVKNASRNDAVGRVSRMPWREFEILVGVALHLDGYRVLRRAARVPTAASISN